MSNFIEIYKPGSVVIPFWLSEEPNRYELNGIGLEKSIEMIEKYSINVPQVCSDKLAQIYCPCKPMIVLESMSIKNNERWLFKVLGNNLSVGWTIMVNPNIVLDDGNEFLKSFGLKKYV